MVAAILAPQGGGCVCIDREIDFNWDSIRDLSVGELVTTERIEGLSAYSPIAFESKIASITTFFGRSLSTITYGIKVLSNNQGNSFLHHRSERLGISINVSTRKPLVFHGDQSNMPF